MKEMAVGAWHRRRKISFIAFIIISICSRLAELVRTKFSGDGFQFAARRSSRGWCSGRRRRGYNDKFRFLDWLSLRSLQSIVGIEVCIHDKARLPDYVPPKVLCVFPQYFFLK